MEVGELKKKNRSKCQNGSLGRDLFNGVLAFVCLFLEVRSGLENNYLLFNKIIIAIFYLLLKL